MADKSLSPQSFQYLTKKLQRSPTEAEIQEIKTISLLFSSSGKKFIKSWHFSRENIYSLIESMKILG